MTRQRLTIASLAVLLYLAALPISLAAQQTKSQAEPISAIPSPRNILSFNPGDDRTIADWKQITNYFSVLDKRSDRVLVQTLGESTLKRSLIVAFISARENILALEKYKDIQQRLADPRKVTSTLERDNLIKDGKVVVAISCSIHSTEIVASQMSMQLAYELAVAQDPETKEILQNTILLLIPSPNPDGIDIVADWYRKTLGTPFEGREPPELYHHYAGHDDNRDWFMLNLKETRLLTRLFWHEWYPEIVYDVHQQGSNGSRFFIPPFYDPANPNISPTLLRQVGLLGHKMAADLQSQGYQGVLTNALYDTWWHGGFRTAPYFHNSIGILSEAASARLMTPTTVTSEQLSRSSTRGMRSASEASTNFPDPWTGGSWHPRDIMAMELIAARSLMSMAAKYREQYLANFYELGKGNVERAAKPGEPVAYLIPAGQGRDESVARMLGSLIEQGVEVFRLEQELHVTYGPQVLKRTNPANEKLGTYRTVVQAAAMMQEVPAGSYIIFLSQPQRSNVETLFEPQIYPNRLTAQGEAERPYDVAGWTLPLQMGVDAPAITAIKEKASEQKLTLLHSGDVVREDLALPMGKGERSPIKNPVPASVRIAIYQGDTGNMDEGWTRFIFDTFNVPYATLKDAQVRKGNLNSNYDVVILPSQRATEIIQGNASGSLPAEYTGGITENGVNHLKEFVTNGGTLICFDASCGLPITQFKLPLQNTLEGLRSADFYSPGSIVSLDIDGAAPSFRGLPTKLPAYFINSSAFAATDPGVKVIARYAKEDVLLSGWLLGEDKLRGQIALAETAFGKGRVVLFAFRPQHRGQIWATLPLIWKAIASSQEQSE
ncbi:MAG TPA: M14 family metallopeptidase [Pyrinomonadaceae bacterium]|nr:M14 family metallopeptidase [Pyrinomonadaceae bacterium]